MSVMLMRLRLKRFLPENSSIGCIYRYGGTFAGVFIRTKEKHFDIPNHGRAMPYAGQLGFPFEMVGLPVDRDGVSRNPSTVRPTETGPVVGEGWQDGKQEYC